MNIEITTSGTQTTVMLDGRLDTTTAPELEKQLKGVPDDTSTLVFDFEKLRYISSAGLRLILAALKNMNAKQGSLIIRKANSLVMEIFDATGLADIITFENE